jgi:hypothetical protein
MNDTLKTDEERFWEHVLHLQNQIRSELDKWDKPEFRMASTATSANVLECRAEALE